MGALPFAFDVGFEEALNEFTKGVKNVIEMLVESKEKVIIGDLLSEDGSVLSSTSINMTEPRFYLLRREGKVYFVFCCPEGCNVRRRMIHATSKGSLISHIRNQGLSVDSVLELSDPTEFDTLLLQAQASPLEQQLQLTQNTFSKPKRPGRGKARIIKQSS